MKIKKKKKTHDRRPTVVAAKWPPVPTSDNGWPLETGDISGAGGLVVDSKGLEVRLVSFEWGGNGFTKNESIKKFLP